MRAEGKLDMSNEEYEGYTAYAYLFWYRAISKHLAIGKNIRQYIKDFFKKVLDDNGGSMSAIKAKADRLFASM